MTPEERARALSCEMHACTSPQCAEDLAAAIRAAVAEEREAIAKEFDAWCSCGKDGCIPAGWAAAIRARA